MRAALAFALALAAASSAAAQQQLRGCYSASVTGFDAATLTSCENICSSEHDYAAINSDYECYCSKDLSEFSESESSCSMPCADNSAFTCGDSGNTMTFSLFLLTATADVSATAIVQENFTSSASSSSISPGVAIGITFGVLGVVVAVLFVIFRHRIAAWYHARADSKGFRPADEFSTLVSPAGPAKKLPRFMQRGNNFTKLDEEEPMHELPNYGQ